VLHRKCGDYLIQGELGWWSLGLESHVDPGDP
jgi:hypothetical protein